MKTIDDKGWFVITMAGLVSGDTAIATRQNSCDMKKIAEICEMLQYSGFARRSRRDWWTAPHPELGMVQWRSGRDFRPEGDYFVLRVNGKLILNCWPQAGHRTTYAKWESEAAKALPEQERHLVERFLGTLGNGTLLPS